MLHPKQDSVLFMFVLVVFSITPVTYSGAEISSLDFTFYKHSRAGLKPTPKSWDLT